MPSARILRVVTSFLCALCGQAGQAEADTRKLKTEPAEVYGPSGAPIALRLGNGGAGPTGVLRALAEDFIARDRRYIAVAWVQNITRLNLQALREKHVDVALAYEPCDAATAIRDGWASDEALVFYDHFVLVGPRDNPALVAQRDTPATAFSKIAAAARKHERPHLFLSRDDASGTNTREQGLWRTAGLAPFTDAAASWYVRDSEFPRETLLRADREGMYTLTDRGTWMSSRREVPNTALFVSGGEMLLNPCHALLGAQPSDVAKAFFAYLVSPRAQALLARFGAGEHDGMALFSPASPAVRLPITAAADAR